MLADSPLGSTHSFRVHSYRSEHAIVVACHGKLTLETSPLLKGEVRRMIPEAKRIILDLKEVPLMDSFGLGALAGLYISCRTRSCKLELTNANKAIRELLGMTHLLSLFEPAARYGGKLP
jgi:anti-anti-sigma factor